VWGGVIIAFSGVRRSAWDAHGGEITALADPVTMVALTAVYLSLDRVAGLIHHNRSPLTPRAPKSSKGRKAFCLTRPSRTSCCTL
jgi:hypothetical protein